MTSEEILKEYLQMTNIQLLMRLEYLRCGNYLGLEYQLLLPVIYSRSKP